MRLFPLWRGWRTQLKRRNEVRKPPILRPATCGRGLWEFILKVHSSATRGGGFILRKIFWLRLWPRLIASGKRRAGHIRVFTIAPELPGALEVITEAAARGVCVSLGHSDAELNAARAGFAAGARHATHTFNAMRPLDHRDPGILGEVLTDSRLSADIIADGIHLDPVIVQLFLKAKGADGAVLITDATAATGMPDGRYRLGSLEVDVKDGRCLAGGKLAGSVLTMDRAVRNVMQFAQWDLQQAVRLATVNPARVTGMKKRWTARGGCAGRPGGLESERRSKTDGSSGRGNLAPQLSRQGSR